MTLRVPTGTVLKEKFVNLLKRPDYLGCIVAEEQADGGLTTVQLYFKSSDEHASYGYDEAMPKGCRSVTVPAMLLDMWGKALPKVKAGG